MSFNRARDAKKPVESPDVLLSTPRAPLRSDASLLVDELARAAGQIKWPRMPELKDFRQMAEMIKSAGYYNLDELADSSTAERTQMYKILPDGLAGWARLLRKILDAKAPPTEIEVKKSLF